jgi:hypothetical protein
MNKPTAINALNALASDHDWNVTEENGGDSYTWTAERWVDGEYEVGFSVEYDLNEQTRRWRARSIAGYVNQSPGDGHTYSLGSVPFRAISHIKHWLSRPDEAAAQPWVQEIKEAD